IVCLAALPAVAGVQSPCADPMVLPSPKVQVFIMPSQGQGSLTARGHELATIVQRHVLFAALKYPSIAVAELTGESGQCAPERIMSHVGARLQGGQGPIFLCGALCA